MEFINQCKAYDSNMLESYNQDNPEERWFYGIKYDGYYCQIHVEEGNLTRFFTASGKEFYNKSLCDKLRLLKGNYILEAEYLGIGEGKLGDRVHAASTTTLRHQFKKGELGDAPKHNIVIFDIINGDIFAHRLKQLRAISSILKDAPNISVCEYIEDVKAGFHDIAETYINDGWEGLMGKSPTHRQVAGRRVKTALKYKLRHKIWVECVGVNEGEGKFRGKIGSIDCVDSLGRKIRVGSGLNYFARTLKPSELMFKKICIAYERITDGVYIQPTVVSIGEY